MSALYLTLDKIQFTYYIHNIITQHPQAYGRIFLYELTDAGHSKDIINMHAPNIL